MARKKSKLQQMLELSDEILSSFENEDIPFEKILLKCKRLARMRDDFDALKWFTLELHGYSESDIPDGIKREELDKYASYSGRTTTVEDPLTKKTQTKYWTASIPELEASIQTYLITLENIKPPAHFTPTVTKHSFESIYTGPTSNEYVVEKYQDVLDKLTIQKGVVSKAIVENRGLLSKIKNTVYNYVLKIHLQLRFEKVTESVFQQTKEKVDKVLAEICPGAMKKFIAAFNRLESQNPAEWSQALSSCRNVLKEFADYVFPSQNEPYELSTGDKIEVTDDKYKNRLIAFIDRETTGSKGKLLKARSEDLVKRIHSLNDVLSSGTHEEKGLTSVDVNICVIDTYLLIGSMLSLLEAREKGGKT